MKRNTKGFALIPILILIVLLLGVGVYIFSIKTKPTASPLTQNEDSGWKTFESSFYTKYSFEYPGTWRVEHTLYNPKAGERAVNTYVITPYTPEEKAKIERVVSEEDYFKYNDPSYTSMTILQNVTKKGPDLGTDEYLKVTKTSSVLGGKQATFHDIEVIKEDTIPGLFNGEVGDKFVLIKIDMGDHTFDIYYFVDDKYKEIHEQILLTFKFIE